MTTVISPISSSPVASSASAASPSNPNHPTLPPIITSPPASSPAPPRRTNLPRPMSHASKSRLSQYSTGSVPSRSRPPSQMFAVYPSSLPYTTVRDFAYAPNHPLHYGPPPEPSHPPSGLTTPSSERRLSDPPAPWDSKMSWDTGSWETASFGRATDLAPIEFRDGPPWSEDEDLQSPVVSSRHRKHKSTSATYSGHHRKIPREERSQSQGSSTLLNPENYDKDRGYYAGTGGDGSERYYVSQGGEANGPGGEYVTYPPDQARHNQNSYKMAEQQPRRCAENDADYRSDASSGNSSPGLQDYDESRYSRDYQFTITSPDEEMHGKAVALYDFQRENENELPLVEGQIIWVSYRHGQGWLVAEDPKTQESGLVPEEYVRLLRDIQGGISGLSGQLETAGSPNDAGTPTQAEHSGNYGNTLASGNTSNGYHQPVVSTFSTSSKDLEPYPQHMLGTQAGHPPPQVVHYHGQRGGSQANTPTLQSHHDVGFMRRGSQDAAPGKNRDSSSKTQGLETLPDVKMDTPEAASKKEDAETEHNVEMTDR